MEIGAARIPAELPEIEALLADVERIDGHPPIGERKSFGLTRFHPDLRGLTGRSDANLVAFVAFSPAEAGAWAMEIAIRPSHRDSEVYAQIFRRAVEEAERLNAERLRAWIFSPGLAAAAVSAGFVEERRLFKMERGLPVDQKPHFPEEITVRSFRPGLDNDDWLALNNRAFAGHPENGDWNHADLSQRLEADWFDPELFLMAWREDRLVGFNWLKRHGEEGEIYVVAVAEKGTGLGTALLLQGLGVLQSRGAVRAFLYVDSENQAALNRYRRLGFYLDHVDRSFVR